MNMKDFEFLTSTIWENNIFKFDEKCLYYKHWIDSKILYVKDLFESIMAILSAQNHCLIN